MISIIAICYNHEQYVEQSLDSIINQNTQYPIQIIIVDDASQDQSPNKIQQWIEEKQKETHSKNIEITFTQNPQNIGICKSFNQALKQVKYKYLIDFATDDLLLPNRLEKQINVLENLPNDFAVCFSNAQIVNQQNKHFYYFYPIDKNGKAKKKIQQGYIYNNILKGYYICTPTMMIKTEVMKQINGYDENLAYEDFDFWIRTAKKYKYAYLDEVTTLKRSTAKSLSTQFYKRKQNPLIESTIKVFDKAIAQNTPQENKILATQIAYYLRLAFYTECFNLVPILHKQLLHCQNNKRIYKILNIIAKYNPPVYYPYMLYNRLRQIILNLSFKKITL